jgi:hypothetical protein
MFAQPCAWKSLRVLKLILSAEVRIVLFDFAAQHPAPLSVSGATP